jgi:hypothetical protein
LRAMRGMRGRALEPCPAALNALRECEIGLVWEIPLTPGIARQQLFIATGRRRTSMASCHEQSPHDYIPGIARRVDIMRRQLLFTTIARTRAPMAA